MARVQGEEIRQAIREKYRSVAARPIGHFPYPVGEASAVELGYSDAWLAGIPSRVVARFVGVGNPFSIREPSKGQRVLDLGCGCGMDAYVASRFVGAEGRAVGVDLTAEMLDVAREGLGAWTPDNLEFLQGAIEDLPFPDESFDLAISNGVLNLAPDKGAAFREILRVLRPGGALAGADLLVEATVPDELLASMDAWST